MSKNGTYNYPYRLDKGRTKRKAANNALCKEEKLDFLGVQEYTDKCVKDVCPDGYGYFRGPDGDEAQSVGLYHKKVKWEPLRGGFVRINSDGHPLRGILWRRYRNRKTGRKKTVAVIHLVAFASRNERARKEHLRQQKKVADWLAKQPKSTVVMGDWNRSWNQMPDMRRVATQSKPLFGTGPSGQKIDYGAKRKEAKSAPKGIKKGPKRGSDHAPYIFRG